MKRMTDEHTHYANSIDFDDCGKKLLCYLAAKPTGKYPATTGYFGSRIIRFGQYMS